MLKFEGLTFEPASGVVSGTRGEIGLTIPLRAALECLLAVPGAVISQSDLEASLASVGSPPAVLKKVRKYLIVILPAVTGGGVILKMTGRDRFSLARNRAGWKGYPTIPKARAADVQR
jgi:hypothetical protein